VRPEDVALAAASLARAFYEDPVLAYMFPDARKRERKLRRFFAFQIRRTYLSRGLAYMSEDASSVALWLPPHAVRPGIGDVTAQLRMLSMLRGRAGKAVQLVRLIESRHPRTPHYYLGGLGTDPARQRNGLAAAVLLPVLEICDSEGVPAYLESSKEENISFYRRQGFQLTGEVGPPDAAVRLWFMWREPQSQPSQPGDG